jgi:hypothetical protein
MTGGHGSRHSDDFYPTPPEALRALLESEIIGAYRRRFWEPACGDGALSRELDAAGHEVVSTDLVDRGYGTGGVDFLSVKEPLAKHILTNPPFKLAEAFIRHAHALGFESLSLLLKSQFWHAAGRLPLFKEHPPAVIAPLTWRLDFTGGGAPTMDCAWVVWGAGWVPCTTRYRPLARPRRSVLPTLEELFA